MWAVDPPRRRGGALALAAGTLIAACADATAPGIDVAIDPPAASQVVVGDFLPLLVRVDGTAGSATWTSSNEFIATVVGGVVEALRPGAVTITAESGGGSAQLSLTIVPRVGGYTAAEIDYFTEIAFGSEFGGATPQLRRWSVNPHMRINGFPSGGDLEVLDSVIGEIGRIAPIDIEIVTDTPSVEIHFVPQSEFTSILPFAEPGNIALVYLWWGADQLIYRSVVMIGIDQTQPVRSHVIREEVTQMLGLLKDSFLYPTSIFYQSFSLVTEYAPIDRAVIELLYRPEIAPGATVQEAARAARLVLRSSPFAGPSAVAPVRPAFGLPGWGASGRRGLSRARFPLPAGPAAGNH